MIEAIIQFIVLFVSLVIVFYIGVGVGYVLNLFIPIDPVWIGILAILASLIEI